MLRFCFQGDWPLWTALKSNGQRYFTYREFNMLMLELFFLSTFLSLKSQNAKTPLHTILCFVTSGVHMWITRMLVNGNVEISITEMLIILCRDLWFQVFSPVVSRSLSLETYETPNSKVSKNLNLFSLLPHTKTSFFAFWGFDQPRILSYTSDLRTLKCQNDLTFR